MIQTLAIGGLAVLSIAVAPALPTAGWTDVLLAPPPVPPAAPPPAVEIVRRERPQRFAELVQPTSMPDRARMIVDDPETVVLSTSSPAGVEGSPGGRGETGGLIGLPGSGPAIAPPPPPPPPVEETLREPSGPVRVSSTIQSARLIRRVEPVYPRIAVQARVHGVVKLQAVIAPDGSIERLETVSGHPLLVRAALEAVKQWRYKPTILNGQAVAVATQIDVHFRLR